MSAKGVVQMIGRCYGAEPPISDEEFGRVSYTQYEAMYARKQGKKVWYLLLMKTSPPMPARASPEQLRQLQAAYRQRGASRRPPFSSAGEPGSARDEAC